MELRAGDFVYYETFGPSGKTIKYIQSKLYPDIFASRITHVSYCVSDLGLVKEAIIPYVSIRPYNYIKKKKIVAVMRPNYIKSKALLDHAVMEQCNYIGTYYGIPQIGGHLIHAACLAAGLKLRRNPIRGGRTCTEDAIYAMRDQESAFGISDTYPDSGGTYPEMLFLFQRNTNRYMELRYTE